MNQYYAPMTAASASVDDRADFIVRTYVHLAGAVFAFVMIEAALFASGVADALMRTVFSGVMGGRFGWLIILAGFMGVSWLANNWAHSNVSRQKQYLGLGLYVVAEAFIFIPLLYVAAYYTSPDVIPTAGLITLILFGGLTGIVLLTKKNFSFMRNVLFFGGIAAMGLIVASAIFGFQLGIIFSWGMLVLAGGYVLYNTSNILHEYGTQQHVAAALALFASMALMFWYVLRILIHFSSSRD